MAKGKMLIQIIKSRIKQLMPAILWKRLRNIYHKLLYYCVFFDIKLAGKRFHNKRKQIAILFYPDEPRPSHEIYRLCHLLGYKKINDLNARYDMAFNWQDVTFRTDDADLARLAKEVKVVNINCRDISKKRVDAVFKEVFGYNAVINPLTFYGECLKKSDSNAKDAEMITQCPIKTTEEGSIYQRLINNIIDDKKFVQEIAAPFFAGSIPFAYLKYKLLDNRFDNCNLRIEITEFEKLVSQEEKEKIIIFCKKIGLDYGELEMIRDTDDKRLYIIDVNSTPIGPIGYISPCQRIEALKKIAENFEKVFD